MDVRAGRRLAAAAIVVAAQAALFVGAAPASATIDSNDVGCAGHAVITPKNGAALTIDAAQGKADLPREASQVTYEGSVSTITHDHAGAVDLILGPAKVKVHDWAGKNAANESSSSGAHEYPSALADVPPGIYRLEGHHRGTEGGCSGHMDIVIAGTPISSPAGAGSLAAVVVALLAVLASGRAKAGGRFKGHPILGVIAGLLLGLFVAIAATFWKVAPLTTPLLAVTIVVGLIIGLVWAALGLLGGGGAATGEAA
jgi:hypothetical protein